MTEPTPYFQSTDVQRTWRRFGWTPPSDDPQIVARWNYYKSLDTERQVTTNAESERK